MIDHPSQQTLGIRKPYGNVTFAQTNRNSLAIDGRNPSCALPENYHGVGERIGDGH